MPANLKPIPPESLPPSAGLPEREDVALYEAIARSRPYLFSPSPVFVSADQADEMARIVRAVEAVAALPAYRQQVLRWAPAIAAHDPGTARVMPAISRQRLINTAR